MSKYFILSVVLFVASVRTQMIDPTFDYPPLIETIIPWSDVPEIKVELPSRGLINRPTIGVTGGISKNLEIPGVRVGVEGHYNQPITSNIEVFGDVVYERNIGDIPAMNEIKVTVGGTFKF